MVGMGDQKKRVFNSVQIPQFFKIFIPEHCSTQLRIPVEFIKYFKGSLPSKCIVMTFTRKWEVDVNKVDGHVYFQGGWEGFVQDNSLQFGDFLLFYYNGELGFYVSLFGKNNCPKDIPIAIIKSEEEQTEFQGNESNDTGEEELEESATEFNDLKFELAMQKSYLKSGYLNIPKVFCEKLKEFKPAAKLQHSDRTWDVKVMNYDKERLRFGLGWTTFVKENCLALEDVCSFKMIGIQPDFFVMDVSFCRGI